MDNTEFAAGKHGEVLDRLRQHLSEIEQRRNQPS
jgi:hypothetical protein